MADRVVDRVRMRLEEVRTRGLVPTVRTRIEEVVTQVKERVGAGGTTGGVLTRETGGTSGESTARRKLRGL